MSRSRCGKFGVSFETIQFGSRLSGGQIEEVALQFVAQVDLHVCMKA
jgi:hypothetical protein